MKKCFWDGLHLGKQNREKLEQVGTIIEHYAAQGYKLTLRQLYYQLVSQDIIPNKVSEYAKLSKLLVNGRMAGEVDWDAIEDRLRVPKIPYWVHGVADAISDTINQYRLNRMDGQDNYIEVWCEKDALSNVLYRVTKEYHIRLMINRGYSSCTAMHDAYERLHWQAKTYILYLGDHDPSGLDMVRDIENRLEEFGADNLEVRHVAITREQINAYQPPPNPAKVTDPRANDYIALHGDSSWEVDALNPETLHELLKKEIEGLIDRSKFERMLEQEERDKERLREFAENYDEEL